MTRADKESTAAAPKSAGRPRATAPRIGGKPGANPPEDIVQRQNLALRRVVEQLSAMMTGGFDLPRLAATICAEIIDALPTGACDAYVRRGSPLVCIASYNLEGCDEEYENRPFSLEHFPMTRMAADVGETVVIPSVDDPRLNEFERQNLEEYDYASELCMPLEVEGEVVGIIDVFDYEPRDYAESLDFVRAMGELFAGVLANSNLVEKLKDANRNLGLLADAGLEFGASLDLDQVLRAIVTAMCTACDAECCEIYRLDPDAVRGLVSVDKGRFVEDFSSEAMPTGELTAMAIVLQSGEPYSVSDIDDPGVPPDVRADWSRWDDIRSGLVLPLVYGGSRMGVLAVYDSRVRDFDALELPRALAQLAAQAMGNADLYRQLELRSREAELLNEIARRTTATLEMDEIARSTLDALKQLLAFDRGVIVVENGEYGSDAYLWRADGRTELIPITDEVDLFASELSRHPIFVFDDPSQLPAEIPGLTDDVVSGVMIALHGDGRVIGSLALASTRRNGLGVLDYSVLERVGTHLSLAVANARMYERIQRLHVVNLKALTSALTAKDYYTVGHAARVSAYMILLARQLGWGLDQSQRIEQAAYLHDIGKIGISDRVLLKPSGLNPHEWELMRRHPIFSADIIRPLFADELVLGVRHHHERWDGDGYPDGLSGEEVPLVARAMAVVDAYDAMSFRRPYRNARSYRECLSELHRCRGSQFDPAMVDAFAHVLRALEGRRAKAIKVAEKAARAIDVEMHLRLNGPEDERRREYKEIAATLRRITAENPPTRYLQTFGQRDGKFVMIVDPDDDPVTHVAVGREVYADQELPEAFAGMRLDSNALVIDEFGAWVSGRVPLMGPDGRVVAVVAADLPPMAGIDLEGLNSDVTETFADMVRSNIDQSTRQELEAITDGLTGLYNHRYLHERLADEVERAAADGKPLTLLLCDLDDFKAFNAQHGYEEGDRALRAVALIIGECLRGVDLVARYGGDEFAAILIETGPAGAAEVADRIRNAVAKARFTPDRQQLTASLGFASFPAHCASREELVDKAEWARLRAKRSGRDAVVAFTPQAD